MSDDRIWGESESGILEDRVHKEAGPARAAQTVRAPDPLCVECARLRIDAGRMDARLDRARSVIRALIGADGLTGGLGDLTMPDGTPLVDAVRRALGGPESYRIPSFRADVMTSGNDCDDNDCPHCGTPEAERPCHCDRDHAMTDQDERDELRGTSACDGICDPMCDWCLAAHECPTACGGGDACPYVGLERSKR